MKSEMPPTIDAIAAARWLGRAPEASPWLHEEVARRMAQRLGWINLKPAAWVDWHPVNGGMAGHDLVRQFYPNSACFVVEVPGNREKFAIKNIAKPWWRRKRWAGSAERFAMPLVGGVQMVWANMGLHMAQDPMSHIAAWHQCLAADGFLMFSCLGPDSVKELRAVYQMAGWPPAAHDMTDMHDWGDMLVQAGFSEPVMDMERITLSFASSARLREELRGLGRNLHPHRFAGLRGRAWRQALDDKLLAAATDSPGRDPLTLTFEVIYGHAFKPVSRLKVQAEAALSLDEMRLALQRGKAARTKPQG